MYKLLEFTKEYYKVGEVAKYLDLTNRTIQNYDKDGRLKFVRLDNNYRVLPKEDLVSISNYRGMIIDDIQQIKNDAIYARVSSQRQKEKGDLDRQVGTTMENTVKYNLQNPIVLKEVGSGLNEKRVKQTTNSYL